jgi:antitoxin YefM
MKVVDFRHARDNLKSLLDSVTEDADYTVIAREDAQAAVVMSLDVFNSYVETFHLLKSPENASHLAKSIEQYQNGEVQERELLNG